MTNSTLSVSAITDSNTSLGVRELPVRTPPTDQQPASPIKQAPSPEDTVTLSSSVQQYLQAAQSTAEDTRGMVEQLVHAAAAGDVGALRLLTII